MVGVTIYLILFVLGELEIFLLPTAIREMCCLCTRTNLVTWVGSFLITLYDERIFVGLTMITKLNQLVFPITFGCCNNKGYFKLGEVLLIIEDFSHRAGFQHVLMKDYESPGLASCVKSNRNRVENRATLPVSLALRSPNTEHHDVGENYHVVRPTSEPWVLLTSAHKMSLPSRPLETH